MELRLKKRMINLTIALGVLTLVGCGGHYYEELPKVLTPIEKSLLISYDKDIFGFKDTAVSYNGLTKSLLRKRLVHATNRNEGISCKHLKNMPELYEYPFCGFYKEIENDELAYKIQFPSKPEPKFITTQFKELYGISMKEACNLGGGDKQSYQNSTELKKDFVVVTGNEGKVFEALTLEMYDKLIDSSKNCTRAKNQLILLTGTKEYLTVADYDEVMSIAMKCKTFELEKELNN